MGEEKEQLKDPETTCTAHANAIQREIFVMSDIRKCKCLREKEARRERH